MSVFSSDVNRSAPPFSSFSLLSSTSSKFQSSASSTIWNFSCDFTSSSSMSEEGFLSERFSMTWIGGSPNGLKSSALYMLFSSSSPWLDSSALFKSSLLSMAISSGNWGSWLLKPSSAESSGSSSLFWLRLRLLEFLLYLSSPALSSLSLREEIVSWCTCWKSGFPPFSSSLWWAWSWFKFEIGWGKILEGSFSSSKREFYAGSASNGAPSYSSSLSEEDSYLSLSTGIWGGLKSSTSYWLGSYMSDYLISSTDGSVPSNWFPPATPYHFSSSPSSGLSSPPLPLS